MNRDQLHNLDAWTAVRAAFAALDGIQALAPIHQVVGVALLFTAMCDGLGIDPSEIINQSRRRAVDSLNDDGLTQRTEMRALNAYVQGELA